MGEDQDSASEAAPTQAPPPKKKKNSWGAKIRGWLILAFLLAFAALSGTVLQKPIMKGAEWMRAHEIAGYFALGGAGWVFIMIGGSANFVDLTAGLIYGTKIGFIVALITKLTATTCAYLAGRYLFRDFLLQYFVEEYIWLAAMARVIKDRPWTANALIRISVIPAAIKSYGLGAIEAPPAPFFTFAVLIMALLSWVFTDLGHKLQKPSDIFKAKSKSSQTLEVVGLVACVVLLIAGAYFGKRYVDEIKNEKKAEIDGSIHKDEEEEPELVLFDVSQHNKDYDENVEGGRGGILGA